MSVDYKKLFITHYVDNLVHLAASEKTELQNLSVNYLSVENAAINYLKVTDADIKFATIDNLSAVNAEIQHIQANYIAADVIASKYLSSEFASVTNAHIELGAITSALIADGAIDTVQIADGSITDGKIVNLTANKINAGTLSVDRLIIRDTVDPEQSLVYQINNIDGALQSVRGDTLNGEIITERSITADRIVAESITSDEIAANSITSNKILAGAVTAGKLNVDTLSAIQANIGTVTAGMLKSSNGQSYFDLTNNKIKTNNVEITGGKITMSTSDRYDSRIALNAPGYGSRMAPGEFYISNSTGTYATMQGHTLSMGNSSGEKVNIGYASGAIYSGDIVSRGAIHSGGVVSSGNISSDGIVGALTKLYAGASVYPSCQLSVLGNAIIGGNFNVYGSKNRIVKTKNYGEVALHAYETPRPIFADTGHARVNKDGLCYIDIDPIFLETIDHVHDYRYYLTKYGQGDIWINKGLSNKFFFVVEGTPNLEFDWKLEAIQRDYNTHNMEQRRNFEEEQEVDYNALAHEHLREYEKELIE